MGGITRYGDWNHKKRPALIQVYIICGGCEMKLFDYKGSVAVQCRGLLDNSIDLGLTYGQIERLIFLRAENPDNLYPSDRLLIEGLKTRHRSMYHKLKRVQKKRKRK